MKKYYVNPPEDGKTKIFEVSSKSKPGVIYKMRIFPDGEIRCECPWNAIRSGECSHIRAYMDMEKEVKETLSPEEKSSGFAMDFPF